MTDVFPRRNLPPESEEWGREVEDRVYQLENTLSVSKQSLSGLNRSSSSTLDNLGLQVQEVKRLYNLLPITRQALGNSSNFAVPTAGAWNNLVSTSVSFTESGTFNFSAVASGQLVKSDSTLLAASYRFVLSTGATSPSIPGAYAFSGGNGVSNFLANYGWTVAVGASSSLTVTLQCNPGAGWPSGSGSYAVMTTYGVFTRA